MTFYALYRGDTFIDVGSKQRLARRIGVSIDTITFYMSPSHLRRSKGNGYIVIRIDDEDE